MEIADKSQATTQTAVNVISNDPTMEMQIRSLVEKAHANGYSFANLHRAMAITWQSLYQTETTNVMEVPLSEEEIALCAKAKKFILHYAKDICTCFEFSEDCRKEYLLSLYVSTCSVLITYYKGEELSLIPIYNTSEKYFSEYDSSVSWSLDILGSFLFKHLRYHADEMPRIPRNYHYPIMNRLDYMYDYIVFKHKHVNCYSKYHRFGLALVWLIGKYF